MSVQQAFRASSPECLSPTSVFVYTHPGQISFIRLLEKAQNDPAADEHG